MSCRFTPTDIQKRGGVKTALFLCLFSICNNYTKLVINRLRTQNRGFEWHLFVIDIHKAFNVILFHILIAAHVV